jgi:tetratricopeptide (TPR) repeat protein
MITAQRQHIFTTVMLAIMAVFLVYIGTFKMLDRDFWWHIKSGEIMVNTHHLISVEPFAYTRAGQPYVATHEWLAQIILYLVYHAAGINGIIVFRIATIFVTFGLLLMIDKRRVWLNSLLVILAANAAQGGFMDRPQLFSFMIFAGWMWLATSLLDRPITKKDVAIGVGLQLLWVNLHGAASLLGFLVLGAVVVQRLWDWYRSPSAAKSQYKSDFMCLAWWLGLLVVALFLSPSGYQNITYLHSLLTDQTTQFISEWQPRPWAQYLPDLAPLWLLGAVALWFGRRRWVFAGLLLLVMGYLSRQALRHEMFLVFTLVAIIIYQLKDSVRFEKFLNWWQGRKKVVAATLVILIAILAGYTHAHYNNFAQKDQIYGFGTFDLAKGAADFIDKQHLTGHMFNTYGIGGYLLYREYPNRQVFIDGRNVDYGFVFMSQAFVAGSDVAQWQKLVDTYNITYAVIDYDAIKTKDSLPYSQHVEKNPDWALVYLDDWTAIYVKRIPANQAVIDKFAFHQLTATQLEFGLQAADKTQADVAELVQELQRVAAANSAGYKAANELANFYVSQGQIDLATQAAAAAHQAQPKRAPVYATMASVAAVQEHWPEAAADYRQMIWLAGDSYPDLNYAAVADVMTKAHEPGWAWWYRLWAHFKGQKASAPVLPTPVPSSSPLSPATNAAVQADVGAIESETAKDIQTFNDQGVDAANQGKRDEAKADFLKALALDPGYPVTNNNLGVWYEQGGDFDQALTYYKEALQRTDMYAEAHYNLATVYYHQGDYKDALSEAQKAKAQGYANSQQLIDLITGKL